MSELDNLIAQAQDYQVLQLVRSMPSDTLTPVSAFLRLRQAFPGPAFLFESCGPDLHSARYSLMGFQPESILSLENAVFKRNGQAQPGNPLHALKLALKPLRTLPSENLPPFSGGYVGYLGYDAIQYLEDIHLQGTAEHPEALLMACHQVVIFDHLKRQIHFIANLFPEQGQLETQYSAALNKIEIQKKALFAPVEAEKPLDFQTLEAPIPEGLMGKAAFCEGVLRIKTAIREGEVFQTVLSERFVQPTQADPFLVYRVLRSLNPSPYLFYLKTEDMVLLGTSPEMLVKSDGQRVSTCPIAGTRPRGKDPKTDLALEQDLLADQKERAEHLMLVDLGRNDIGKVAAPGSVEVTQYMQVERFSHVMHLVSLVEGVLDTDKTALDALLACFPAGTLSGAPKVRAMELIAEIEPFRRGWYGGAVFYHDFAGHLDACITIRSLAIAHGKAYLQAGAGVVADSQAKMEYQEVCNKAKVMFQALALAESLQGEQ